MSTIFLWTTGNVSLRNKSYFMEFSSITYFIKIYFSNLRSVPCQKFCSILLQTALVNQPFIINKLCRLRYILINTEICHISLPWLDNICGNRFILEVLNWDSVFNSPSRIIINIFESKDYRVKIKDVFVNSNVYLHENEIIPCWFQYQNKMKIRVFLPNLHRIPSPT